MRLRRSVPVWVVEVDSARSFLCADCGQRCVEGVDAVVCRLHFECGDEVALALCSLCVAFIGGPELAVRELMEGLPESFEWCCPVCGVA